MGCVVGSCAKRNCAWLIVLLLLLLLFLSVRLIALLHVVAQEAVEARGKAWPRVRSSFIARQLPPLDSIFG